MTTSRSGRRFANRAAVAAVGVLGMMFAGCKSERVGAVDAAADVPLASVTSTGTASSASTGTTANTGPGTASATSTQASTGPGTASGSGTMVHTGPGTASGSATKANTGPGTVSATSTVSSATTGTASGLPDAGSRTATSTATATGTGSTSTVPATTTGTATSIGPWREITVIRGGLLTCPVEGSAASVTIKRGPTGSLVLSGRSFIAAPGETDGCVSAFTSKCFKEQAFAETPLTPAQRDQLDGLVAAMPPGKCTPKFGFDPCITTRLAIDDVTDTDWGSIACTEGGEPGSHLAGLRAIVAYIDSLIPGKAQAGVDAAVAETAPPLAYPTGPCDIYADAQTPCVAAYSMIRVLFRSYNGPLFQIRGGSSSLNNTMSGGTTKDIMPGPDGFVDAATVDEACGSGYCTVSAIYDHTWNRNDLKRAPKGNTAAGETAGRDDYESIATKGQVTAGGHRVYSLFMNKLEGYRTQSGVVGKGMSTGSQPQGIYMLADGTRNATGCCWEFGNVTSKPATELASAEALYFGASTSARGAGTGPWFLADLGSALYAGGEVGDPGLNPVPNPGNPSLKVPFALGFLRVSATKYAIRVADLSKASDPTTAYAGQLPITMSQKGGIVLGGNGENANTSWGTFYEGAIISGSPSNDVELSVMKNIQAVGYAK